MNPLLKNKYLRAIYRFFVPLQSADVQMDSFCAGFEATAQEQHLIQADAEAKVKAAQAKVDAASAEKNRATIAAKNIKKMLTQED